MLRRGPFSRRLGEQLARQHNEVESATDNNNDNDERLLENEKEERAIGLGDLLAVARMFTRGNEDQKVPPLPWELTLYILDLAEYWCCTTARTDRHHSGCNLDELYLQTRPLALAKRLNGFHSASISLFFLLPSYPC